MDSSMRLEAGVGPGASAGTQTCTLEVSVMLQSDCGLPYLS